LIFCAIDHRQILFTGIWSHLDVISINLPVETNNSGIIKGIDETGEPIKSITEEGTIDLQSWVPPEDRSRRILEGPVWYGIAITTGNFERLSEKVIIPLSERIKQFVEEMWQKYAWKIPDYTPLAVYILVCTKLHSPLPPEFWRGTIFHVDSNKPNLKTSKNKMRIKDELFFYN